MSSLVPLDKSPANARRRGLRGRKLVGALGVLLAVFGSSGVPAVASAKQEVASSQLRCV